MRQCNARLAPRATWWLLLSRPPGSFRRYCRLPCSASLRTPAASDRGLRGLQPGAFGYAGVNMPFDSDGYVRDAELIVFGKQKAASFPVFMAEEYLAQVDPQCKNCTLQQVDKGNAQFRGYRVPFRNPEARTFRIGDWSPHPASTFQHGMFSRERWRLTSFATSWCS